MASAAQRKKPCSKCTKASGIFTCRGCGKDFCYPHVAEHRQELNQHMGQLTHEHDQFQQTIADQEAEPSRHPLIERINQWEQSSIDKIHQAAAEARKDLLATLSSHRTEVMGKLAQLTQELSKACNDDDYVETDLKEWKENLEKLRENLAAAHTINFGQDNSGSALISKIFISGALRDFFDQPTDNIRIVEGGALAIHGETEQWSSVRGKGEYSSGKHYLRFKIGLFSENSSFVCGVLSKNVSMASQKSALESYDIATPHYYSRHNIHPQAILLPISKGMHSYNGFGQSRDPWNAANTGNTYALPCFVYSADAVGKDDIIQLCIDCDRRTMSSTNERSGQTQSLKVDLNNSPFPWQFFIALCSTNDSVRLCEERSEKPTKNGFQRAFKN